MFGLITPALSAFLHNASTVYVSARDNAPPPAPGRHSAVKGKGWFMWK
ncbi:MAG: hypothetical protein ACLT8E_03305 [Akkermansia sp.]